MISSLAWQHCQEAYRTLFKGFLEAPAMGNLLITIPSKREPDSLEVHRKATSLLSRVKGQSPSHLVDTGYCYISTYPRANGSGGRYFMDERSGDWIATVGTWFHESGFSSDQEEKLLERFSVVGAERLAGEIEGFFLVAVGNGTSREVTVITDVVGTLHCYSREIDGASVICTSSIVLAALADVTVDVVACQEFLQTAAMYDNRTFYREVRKLDAARCYVYSPNGSAVRRYWQVTDLEPDSLDGRAATAAFKSAMTGAASRIGSAFELPAVDLTGGYDSRAAVAAFHAAKAPFETVVVGDDGHIDVEVANSLARLAGFRHAHSQPSRVNSVAQLEAALGLTDGEWDVVQYAPVAEVHLDLADRCGISVNGYSGEIGRGYGWEVLMPSTGRRAPLDCRRIAGVRLVNRSFESNLLAPDLRFDPAVHYAEVLTSLASGLEHLPNTLQYDYVMTMTRCQRWYGRVASSTNQIWPCLSIFLLLSVIRPMLETSTRSKRNSGVFRRSLADWFPLLADHTLANGYPAAPLTIANFLRFWPALKMYSDKAVGRLRRVTAPADLDSARPAAGTPGLAGSEELRALLNPNEMRSADLYDISYLRTYINRIQDPSIAMPAQWSLVLTLECALRRVEQLRATAIQCDWPRGDQRTPAAYSAA
jgi:hypothetical protein